MKTAKHPDMRKEYRRESLGSGVRGKYYENYRKGTNIVLLSPDVAAAFPDDDSVNNSLSGLLEVAQQSIGLANRSSRLARARALTVMYQGRADSRRVRARPRRTLTDSSRNRSSASK